MTDDAIVRWLESVIDRHTRAMSRPEFLKAIRALSVRYVERRASLGAESPLDSAGKRAAFAAFYAPLHFLTARAIAGSLGAALAPLDTIVDLGCGTGVSGAAWALECLSRPVLHGTDLNSWALTEARWNWQALGLRGRATRGDFVDTLQSFAAAAGRAARQKRSGERAPDDSGGRTGFMLGWSLNELPAPARERALDALMTLARRGNRIVVIEPLAGRAAPWWTAWSGRATEAGGRADDWRLPTRLPPLLAEIDEAAGFRREALTARTVVFNLPSPGAASVAATPDRR